MRTSPACSLPLTFILVPVLEMCNRNVKIDLNEERVQVLGLNMLMEVAGADESGRHC